MNKINIWVLKNWGWIELYKLLDFELIYDVINLFLQDTWSQRIPLFLSIGLKIYFILQKQTITQQIYI